MLMSSAAPLTQLENQSEFIARHIGMSEADEMHMLSVIGEASRRSLIDSIVPASIARSQAMKLPAPLTEAGALAELKAMAQQNKILKSFIGQGYYGTHTPGVILRNILENPGPIPERPKTGIAKPTAKLRITPPTTAISSTMISEACFSSRFGIRNLSAK